MTEWGELLPALRVALVEDGKTSFGSLPISIADAAPIPDAHSRNPFRPEGPFRQLKCSRQLLLVVSNLQLKVLRQLPSETSAAANHMAVGYRRAFSSCASKYVSNGLAEYLLANGSIHRSWVQLAARIGGGYA